mmetsp:Transcript_15511/g.15430  ORF Transcript_15511/g.15430 Transcript_15511/m.15430 type:complete len:115 (+) Transcript_15511:148-492(+)
MSMSSGTSVTPPPLMEAILPIRESVSGLIAKFNAADGSIVWETVLSDLGAAFWIKYDAFDESLYYTGTTTYGRTGEDLKDHDGCSASSDDSCVVTSRMSASTEDVKWVQTGSPR